MSWEVEYLPEAVKDLKELEGSRRPAVLKAILKVSQNPLPASEGGYGKPLVNKAGSALSGFLKIKLKGYDLRVVYGLVRTDSKMKVVKLGRADEEVYDESEKRIPKYRRHQMI